MPLGSTLQAWRLTRRLSVETLATHSGLTASIVEGIETGDLDPPASSLDRLARALGIPVTWLFVDPSQITLLTTDGDGDATGTPSATPDPVIQQILDAARQDRTLFVLLTALLQSGEPKLLTAAEASLRSLVRQARRSSVPWQSRPSGHFEPPSD
ncbi:MAG: helix-turn-helix transcriptional regulator [Nitrospira sp.]|nr:MAG: helix-turn-helix transcriptional regulator [Nitrospira sp.]